MGKPDGIHALVTYVGHYQTAIRCTGDMQGVTHEKLSANIVCYEKMFDKYIVMAEALKEYEVVA